jgi:hypothetical protein
VRFEYRDRSRRWTLEGGGDYRDVRAPSTGYQQDYVELTELRSDSCRQQDQ